MKFLLDVCSESRGMRTMLVDDGHDVLSASENDPRASDESLLALATREERVLITEDKDFGELVFLRGLPRPCIIRFVDMPVAEKVSAMRDLIQDHPQSMVEGNLIVVTQNRVRIRAFDPEN